MFVRENIFSFELCKLIDSLGKLFKEHKGLLKEINVVSTSVGGIYKGVEKENVKGCCKKYALRLNTALKEMTIIFSSFKTKNRNISIKIKQMLEELDKQTKGKKKKW